MYMKLSKKLSMYCTEMMYIQYRLTMYTLDPNAIDNILYSNYCVGKNEATDCLKVIDYSLNSTGYRIQKFPLTRKTSFDFVRRNRRLLNI